MYFLCYRWVQFDLTLNLSTTKSTKVSSFWYTFCLIFFFCKHFHNHVSWFCSLITCKIVVFLKYLNWMIIQEYATLLLLLLSLRFNSIFAKKKKILNALSYLIIHLLLSYLRLYSKFMPSTGLCHIIYFALFVFVVIVVLSIVVVVVVVAPVIRVSYKIWNLLSFIIITLQFRCEIFTKLLTTIILHSLPSYLYYTIIFKLPFRMLLNCNRILALFSFLKEIKT